MRIASFILALVLHLLVGLAFWGASFTPRIHVDLNRKIYNVVLVNLPHEKKLAEPVKDVPAVKQTEPEKKLDVVKKTVGKPEKTVKKQVKPLKPKPRTAPQKKISPQKVKPGIKPKIKPKADVKKQQDERAELQKALGSVSKILRDQKEEDERKLAHELAALRESVRPESGESEGKAILVKIYGAQVKLMIQKNWRWPGFKDMALGAQVIVNLSQEGKVLSCKIGKSSGRADFDSSVLRAVDDTKDLPVPPGDVRMLELNFNTKEMLR